MKKKKEEPFMHHVFGRSLSGLLEATSGKHNQWEFCGRRRERAFFFLSALWRIGRTSLAEELHILPTPKSPESWDPSRADLYLAEKERRAGVRYDTDTTHTRSNHPTIQRHRRPQKSRSLPTTPKGQGQLNRSGRSPIRFWRYISTYRTPDWLFIR